MNYKVVLSISFILLLLSCDKKRIVQRYSGSQVQLKCEMKNGKKDGECIGYYPDGSVEYTANYKNDLLHGESVFYHRNGVINWTVTFTNGHKNGEVIYYDSLGRKFQLANFKNSDLHGVSIMYDTSGNIERRMNYKAGVLHGDYKSFFNNGKVKIQSTHENGEVRSFTEYDLNGQIVDELIQYKIVFSDSNTLNIELLNPMYDVLGVEILSEIKNSDTLEVQETLFSLTSTVNYEVKNPPTSKVIKGKIIELDTLESGQGIVKRTRTFDFSLKD